MDATWDAAQIEVPAGMGRAVRLSASQQVRVTDLAGNQVGDIFAFAAGPTPQQGLAEHHSAAHTRAVTSRLFPAVGEHFVTDRRRPILTLLADTSPGQHDMLIAACDPARYQALGVPGHRSCAQNMREALAALEIGYAGPTPQPINVFMRIPLDADGSLSWLPAQTEPGDAITFEAAMDCVVVVSACPQDLVGINGAGPTPLAVEVIPTDHLNRRPTQPITQDHPQRFGVLK